MDLFMNMKKRGKTDANGSDGCTGVSADTGAASDGDSNKPCDGEAPDYNGDNAHSDGYANISSDSDGYASISTDSSGDADGTTPNLDDDGGNAYDDDNIIHPDIADNIYHDNTNNDSPINDDDEPRDITGKDSISNICAKQPPNLNMHNTNGNFNVNININIINNNSNNNSDSYPTADEERPTTAAALTPTPTPASQTTATNEVSSDDSDVLHRDAVNPDNAQCRRHGNTHESGDTFEQPRLKLKRRKNNTKKQQRRARKEKKVATGLRSNWTHHLPGPTAQHWKDPHRQQQPTNRRTPTAQPKDRRRPTTNYKATEQD